jgi:hypothetical protein
MVDEINLQHKVWTEREAIFQLVLGLLLDHDIATKRYTLKE